jgi:dTDP-4-dehydrorhamnose reductase
VSDSEILITGSNGQLGLALKEKYPGAKSADADELDITKMDSLNAFNWEGIKYIFNAAAYTNVDGAESGEGRVAAWNVNALAVANLVKLASKKDITLIHVSSDYVFDGSQSPHTENENFSPLSVYGESKAAGDIVVGTLSKYYIIRTSWVIGEGKNFIRTMLDLGKKGINPTVVADQVGRLSFTNEVVRAIAHLIDSEAAYGTYNVSGSGSASSWADIAREIFNVAEFDLKVTDTTTQEYYAGKEGIAPRPLMSELDLSKIEASGLTLNDWHEDLSKYINKELSEV